MKCQKATCSARMRANFSWAIENWWEKVIQLLMIFSVQNYSRKMDIEWKISAGWFDSFRQYCNLHCVAATAVTADRLRGLFCHFYLTRACMDLISARQTNSVEYDDYTAMCLCTFAHSRLSVCISFYFTFLPLKLIYVEMQILWAPHTQTAVPNQLDNTFIICNIITFF